MGASEIPPSLRHATLAVLLQNLQRLTGQPEEELRALAVQLEELAHQEADGKKDFYKSSVIRRQREAVRSLISMQGRRRGLGEAPAFGHEQAPTGMFRPHVMSHQPFGPESRMQPQQAEPPAEAAFLVSGAADMYGYRAPSGPPMGPPFGGGAGPAPAEGALLQALRGPSQAELSPTAAAAVPQSIARHSSAPPMVPARDAGAQGMAFWAAGGGFGPGAFLHGAPERNQAATGGGPLLRATSERNMVTSSGESSLTDPSERASLGQAGAEECVTEQYWAELTRMKDDYIGYLIHFHQLLGMLEAKQTPAAGGGSRPAQEFLRRSGEFREQLQKAIAHLSADRDQHPQAIFSAADLDRLRRLDRDIQAYIAKMRGGQMTQLLVHFGVIGSDPLRPGAGGAAHQHRQQQQQQPAGMRFSSIDSHSPETVCLQGELGATDPRKRLAAGRHGPHHGAKRARQGSSSACSEAPAAAVSTTGDAPSAAQGQGAWAGGAALLEDREPPPFLEGVGHPFSQGLCEDIDAFGAGELPIGTDVPPADPDGFYWYLQ